MTRDEIKKILNLYITMYPKALQNVEDERKRNGYIEVFEHQLGKFNYEDCEGALYHIQATSPNNYSPNMATLIECTKAQQKTRDNKAQGSRRIVTPEEDCAWEYIEIMKSVKDGKTSMTDELKDYLKRLAPYYLLFNGEGWEERYIAHFHKPREEFERMD